MLTNLEVEQANDYSDSAIDDDVVFFDGFDNFENALEVGWNNERVAGAGFGGIAIFVDHATAAFEDVEVFVLVRAEDDTPAPLLARPDAGADFAAGVGEMIPGSALRIALQPPLFAWMIMLR